MGGGGGIKIDLVFLKDFGGPTVSETLTLNTCELCMKNTQNTECETFSEFYTVQGSNGEKRRKV